MPPPSRATKIHLASEASDPRQARVELATLVDKFNLLLDSLGDAAFSDSSTQTSTFSLPIGTIMDFFLSQAPQGWTELDGKTISQNNGELYYPLFAKIHEIAREPSPRLPNLFSTRALNLSNPRDAWTGRETLTLPNLAGRTRIARGSGNNLTSRTLGEVLGIEKSLISFKELPDLTFNIVAYYESTSGGKIGYTLSYDRASHGVASSARFLNTTAAPEVTEEQRPLSNMQPSFAVLTCIKL